jgi:hypothetical protein
MGKISRKASRTDRNIELAQRREKLAVESGEGEWGRLREWKGERAG